MGHETRIFEVVHRNGDRATGAPRRPNSTLFEVADGQHQGNRGADADLFDLVGALDWDREWVSIYETGERVPADAFSDRPKTNWGAQ